MDKNPNTSEQAHAAKDSPFLDRAIEQARANPPTPDMLGSWRDPAAKDSPTPIVPGPLVWVPADHRVTGLRLESKPVEGAGSHLLVFAEYANGTEQEVIRSYTGGDTPIYHSARVPQPAKHHPFTQRGEAAEPIPMILHCPKCGLQHIDAPEHALAWTGGAVPEPSHDEVTWENPPHRSHLCHGCGHIWRPADVPTEGVAEIKTRGKNDSPTHHHEAGGAPGREALIAYLRQEFVDVYDCSRVWEAWHYGTMSERDFSPTEERVEEIADAILALWAKPDQQGREQVIGELCEAAECARIKLSRYREQHGNSYIGGVAAEYDAVVARIDAALSRARSAAQ